MVSFGASKWEPLGALIGNEAGAFTVNVSSRVLRLAIVILGMSMQLGIGRASASPKDDSRAATDGTPTFQLRGLGINAKLGRSKELDDRQLEMMQSLGVSVVVWTPGEWATNEQQRGQYTLDPEVRRVIHEIAEAHMRTIVALFRRNEIYHNPLDPTAFALYCEWVATTLKDEPIAAYQIWNEPSNFDFRNIYGGSWNGRGDAPWVDKFSELTRMAAQAVRRADAHAKIIVSFDGPASIYAFRRHPQDFKDIDGLSLHPYSFKLPPEQVPYGGTAIYLRDGVSIADSEGSLGSTVRIQSVDQPEKYLGRSFEAWITEYGFPTCDAGSIQKYFACVSPETQAAYEVRALILGFAQGVKLWTVYELSDEGNNTSEVEQNFGLTKSADSGFARKPAFFAIQRVAHFLGSDWTYLAKFPARLDICNGESQCEPAKWTSATAGPKIFWFGEEHKYIGFVWNAGVAERAPGAGRLCWSAPSHKITKVRVTDVVNGEMLAPTITSRNDALVIDQVPLESHPVAIEIWEQ
jgi:hypothetical protein